MVNGGNLGTKDPLSPAQGRCLPHPNDLLGQPLINEGRVRGAAPWASVGRSHPTVGPEGTLGSVALETRALWRSCWLEKKLAPTRLIVPPPPSPKHINPAVPRVQPGWSAYESLSSPSAVLFHPLLWGSWAPSHIPDCDPESRGWVSLRLGLVPSHPWPSQLFYLEKEATSQGNRCQAKREFCHPSF